GPIDCVIPKGIRDREAGFGSERVVLLGETPGDARGRARKLFALAAATVAAYIGLVVFSRRRRAGAPRVVDEARWSLRAAAGEVHAAIRRLEGTDRFLVIDEGAGRM